MIITIAVVFLINSIASANVPCKVNDTSYPNGIGCDVTKPRKIREASEELDNNLLSKMSRNKELQQQLLAEISTKFTRDTLNNADLRNEFEKFSNVLKKTNDHRARSQKAVKKYVTETSENQSQFLQNLSCNASTSVEFGDGLNNFSLGASERKKFESSFVQRWNTHTKTQETVLMEIGQSASANKEFEIVFRQEIETILKDFEDENDKNAEFQERFGNSIDQISTEQRKLLENIKDVLANSINEEQAAEKDFAGKVANEIQEAKRELFYYAASRFKDFEAMWNQLLQNVTNTFVADKHSFNQTFSEMLKSVKNVTQLIVSKTSQGRG